MQVIRIPRHNIDENTGYLPWPVTPDLLHLWPPERLALMTPQTRKASIGGDVIRGDAIIGYQSTRRSDMTWSLTKHGFYGGRMDIILVNVDAPCTCCGHIAAHQHVLYPAPHGRLRGSSLLLATDDSNPLSDEDRAWAEEESQKCWATALREPVFMAAVYGNLVTITH